MMDISKIRFLLNEGFAPDERHALTSETGQGEAELVLRALKSLFEHELAALKSGAGEAARNAAPAKPPKKGTPGDKGA